MSSKKTISNSFNVNTVEDGESPYFADLDNEMDSVLCNASGYTTSEQALTTNINYVKGITSLKPYTSIVCSIDGVDLSSSYVEESSPRNTFKASVNTNTGAVVITVRNNKSVDKVVVNIAVTADGQTQNLVFTINGVRSGANGADAVILSLVPSVNEIVKKKDGTYSPTANTYITCAVKKRVGNGTISDAPSSEYTLKYILNETGGEQTYSSTAIKASDVTKNVVFILYDKAGTPNVLDRETVGLITDGEDSPVASANPATISVPVTGGATSKVISAVSQSISFGLTVGNSAATLTGVVNVTVPTGVTVTTSGNTKTISVAKDALESNIKGGVVFRVKGTYNGKPYYALITIALVCAHRGLTGDTGKMGRFPYFAAIWDSSDSTQLFTADDTKTPFFAVLESGQYHYYVYKGNSNFADKSMNWINSFIGAPSSSNDKYEIMYDDFSYIITKCIFGEYAHFGASIINGDFFISQYGYMRGFGEEHVSITDGSQYMNMEANDPYGEGDLFNDQTKFLLNNGGLQTSINDSSWTSIITIEDITLSASKYYTLQCDAVPTAANGDTISVKIVSGSTDIAQTQAICYYPSGGECYILFKPTTSVSTFTVKAKSSSNYMTVKGLYIREAQFVPNVCIDMLRGKLAANDIIARGKLCMDSAYYENNIMLYNDRRITVKNESMICLSDQAYNTDVVLPSPSSCQGRQIEIFSMSPSWTLRWSGATWNDYFLNPYDSNGTPPAMKQWGNGNGTALESHTQYLRLYSNGSAWVVLCVNWGYTQ